MRKLLLVFLALCYLSLPTLQAQTKEIKGKITDPSGAPVIGASVKIKGTNKGTVTGTNGTFSVNVKPGTVLIVSAIGYETKEAVAENASAILLTEDAKSLEDVVVTGVAQGTSRAKVPFALTKVSAAQINTVPALDVSQTLRGKVAGIQISQSNGDDGATVFLRGAKSMFGNISPLIVIDGFVTGLGLSDLNPQDIESIEVVKGAAAAALYGTRAEGGVIQIITKKGKTGGAINITVDNEYGINNIQRTPNLATMHRFKVNPDGSFVLNGFSRTVDYKDNGFSVNLHPYKNYYNNTDNLLGNKPFYTNFVSVATSGDRYNLYASFQNQYTGGVAEPVNPNKRRTAKFNFGFRPNPKIETEVTLQYYNDVKPSSAVTSGDQGTFFAASLQYEPFINLAGKGPNGQYLVKPEGWDIQAANLSNPMYEWSNRDYTNTGDNVLLGGKFKYKILQNLSVDVMGSVNKEVYKSSNYYPQGFQTITPSVTLNDGYYGLSYSDYYFINGQAQINYNKAFENFTIGGTAKMVYEASEASSFSASGYDLSAPVYDLDAARADTRSISSGSPNTTVNYGYYLNLKGSWRDKFFVDALGRIDRSSRYGIDVASAFFPRVAVAYRLTKDVNLGAVNELKLRASYGKAGSLPGYGAKASLVSFSSSGSLSENQKENTNLQRSVTEEWEFGTDAVILNKINVQLNYALARSQGDVVRAPSFVPTLGSTPVYSNFGLTKSTSLELEVSGNVVNKKNFAWDFGATFGRTTGQIVTVGRAPFTDGVFYKADGLSPFAMYGNKVLTRLDELQVGKDGFVLNTGGGTLRPDDFTINSKGFVVVKSALGTAAEAPVFYVNPETGAVASTVIGDAQPDFQIGLNNTFTLFKNFMVYATLDWRQGGQKYDNTTQYLTFDARSAMWQDYALSGLPLTFVQGLYNGNAYTSPWVMDNSYVSLRELSVSYNLPARFLSKAKAFKGIRLALIGRNLFTWTDYPGTNPEGSTEYFPYPVYRTYTGKLTLNF